MPFSAMTVSRSKTQTRAPGISVRTFINMEKRPDDHEDLNTDFSDADALWFISFLYDFDWEEWETDAND